VATFDEQGKATRFTGTSIDITDLKVTQDALEESERRYRDTFENAPVGIVQTDFDARFVRVNQKLSEITGYSKDELVGKTAFELTHPEDRAASFAGTRAIARGEVSSTYGRREAIPQEGRHDVVGRHIGVRANHL